MFIHYRYRSASDYKRLRFDESNVSVMTVKTEILKREAIATDTFTISITNAQTGALLCNMDELVPPHSSLLIARIPAPKSTS